MIINLSSSSTSHALLRFLNSRTQPISDFSVKTKAHYSPLEYTVLGSSSSRFCSKTPFLCKNSRFRQGRRKKFRTLAVSGLDFGSFESAQSVLEAAAVLTAIIVVHESGHFLAAHLQGIHVSKFAVGFGPILAKFNSKKVEYSIRAFPLGGFVGFPDNDPDSDIPVDDENLLKNRPVFDRVIVISAGVIANIVFAFVIVFTQIVLVGLPVQESFPGVLVPEVRPLSAASRSGLLPGDVILGVNDIELLRTSPSLVSEVVDIIRDSPKRKVLFKIERGRENLEINITPDKNSDGTGRIGVQLSPNIKFSKAKPKNLQDVFRFAGREFWGLTSNVLDGLKQTFLNFSQTASKVSGPIAILAVGAEVAKSNADGLYQFAAILNLNLAVINLLPLPALDGGSLALILIEAARGGRKLPLELEQRIMSSGINLVLVLGIYLLVRDTLNLEFIKELL
ncbi:probable membrane metalloprotease ARASP2, chloroplastic [Primulina eburnea]|uniref:probable membrane metalloprotease ARASP2, chloroplastic n=1 Tax=Primulina eburnea TaxID=1245227 RepID=UPI003C6C6BC0